MKARKATHAGTWYSGSKSVLNHQLDQFLHNVPSKSDTYESLPVPGARIIVGPHAGYAYAGQTLANAYKCWDTTNIKRVFILGPSHYHYFQGAMLTPFDSYQTPLGDIPVDTKTIKELRKTTFFRTMSELVDEEEHSFELHMPFLYKTMADSPSGVILPIIPILIGNTTRHTEAQLATAMAPYIADPENAFMISTDFCHWGKRFDYLSYIAQKPSNLSPENFDDLVLKNLSSVSKIKSNMPIYKSIELLDRLGMDIASTGSTSAWNKYISLTKNTICGRRPLGILIAGIAQVKKELLDDDLDSTDAIDSDNDWGKLKWVAYSQSSKADSVFESSVSYAGGYAIA
ncbi:UPF0103-domain-containing protein [Nadsonia fulvescens var. elongata DSM 6958]|uniref:UPF0103-domain-containing protein n=1 Tax=Nadsonia fulvescens var. elongata DSM 6958 TaxID=857566 RepID=A0A1E3PMW4_9ASCO|nr:UPF0103-domain-containing protein [Nadsonia fulvescens var. elongata DSM 6958]